MGFKEVLGLCHFIVLSSIIIFTTQNLEWDRSTLLAVSESRLTIISPLALGLFRVLCIMVIWGALLYITFTKKPLFLTVALRSGKKKMVSLLHTQRYSMFTVWCWTIQGWYFLFAAYCSFVTHFSGAPADSIVRAVFVAPSQWLLNATWVLFEIGFPMSFVVSSMVTFVLIPFAKKANLPTDNFYILVPLLMHNANILFMAIEIVVNRLPFAIWHFPFILLYGTSYAVFSWVWNHYNGYYFYFFLDYTRPGAILWYVALMVIVALFFMLGYGSSAWMNSTESLLPSLMVIGVTLLVTKFHD